MVATIYIIIGIVLGIIIFIGFILLARRNSKGDVLADILEERSDGSVVIVQRDIGIKWRRDKTGNIDAWQIKGLADFQPIDRSFFLPVKNNSLDKIYLFRDKNGNIEPMAFKLNHNRIEMTPSYRDHIDWLVYETEERAKLKEKEGKWKEYMPTVTLALCMAIFFVTCYFGWDYSKTQSSAVDAKLNDFNAKIAYYNELYNPEVLQKAQAIVARERINVQTQNWTSTQVPVSGAVS